MLRMHVGMYVRDNKHIWYIFTWRLKHIHCSCLPTICLQYLHTYSEQLLKSILYFPIYRMAHTELLKRLYYGDGAGAGASASRLYTVAKAENRNVTYTQVVQFLHHQKSYQLHRQAPKRNRYPKYISKRFIQVGMPGFLVLDLMVLNRFPTRFKFLFVSIDAVTRYICTSFMRIINSRNATNAFRKIIDEQWKWPYWRVTTAYTDEVSLPHIFHC